MIPEILGLFFSALAFYLSYYGLCAVFIPGKCPDNPVLSALALVWFTTALVLDTWFHYRPHHRTLPLIHRIHALAGLTGVAAVAAYAIITAHFCAICITLYILVLLTSVRVLRRQSGVLKVAPGILR